MKSLKDKKYYFGKQIGVDTVEQPHYVYYYSLGAQMQWNK